MNRIAATKLLKEHGFSLSEAWTQVAHIVSLWEAGRGLELRGDIAMVTPKGWLDLADVYDALGVEHVA